MSNRCIFKHYNRLLHLRNFPRFLHPVSALAGLLQFG